MWHYRYVAPFWFQYLFEIFVQLPTTLANHLQNTSKPAINDQLATVTSQTTIPAEHSH